MLSICRRPAVFRQQVRCFGSYNPMHKCPGYPYELNKPAVPPPRGLEKSPDAKLDGLAKWVPHDWKRTAMIESLRHGGDFVGKDPYELLSEKHWSGRRYNVSYKDWPVNLSSIPGIVHLAKLNVWCVHWRENDAMSYRWFRCMWGMERAKQAAEGFYKKLLATGRIDKYRSERQIRSQYLIKQEAMKLRKKRFKAISHGTIRH